MLRHLSLDLKTPLTRALRRAMAMDAWVSAMVLAHALDDHACADYATGRFRAELARHGHHDSWRGWRVGDLYSAPTSAARRTDGLLTWRGTSAPVAAGTAGVVIHVPGNGARGQEARVTIGAVRPDGVQDEFLVD